MKVYTNQNNILDGITAVVKHKNKDQAARLELAESFILCGHQAYSGCNEISGQSGISVHTFKCYSGQVPQIF